MVFIFMVIKVHFVVRASELGIHQLSKLHVANIRIGIVGLSMNIAYVSFNKSWIFYVKNQDFTLIL